MHRAAGEWAGEEWAALTGCQWDAVPAPRKIQVPVQVLHCSGGPSSAIRNSWGVTVNRSDGSRAWISVCTRRGRWSAKANGLATSRHFSNEASQELAGSSLIWLGDVPECVFTFFFFPLSICKWTPAKLLDKISVSLTSVSYEFQIATFIILIGDCLF